jgi:glycerol-3-phosphate dehydrogenase
LDRIFDLAIIGGGINGCGIARDAAGRGNSVFLCEMNDLASGTSSWSTKLVHGGLRYLEYYEFRLVREALIEREILWQIAPHIIRPLRFVLPHHAGLRPAWLLRLGLFLYDHIGGRNLLPPTRSVDLTRDEVGKPLIANRYTKGFEYSDCFVDDARLVVLTARDAADRGAEIRTRSRAVEIRQADGIWQVTVENTISGERTTISARALVNAGGPWVEQVLASGAGVNARAKVRLVQGSHIVVRKLYDARPRLHVPEQRRPHRLRHSLSGRFHADRHHRSRLRRRPGQGESLAEEIKYLCDSVSEYLAKPVSRRTWSGPIPACARSMTTAPAKPRPRPAITCSNSTRPAARRCCRSMAARSRPIAASPRRRWNGCRPICAAPRRAKAGPQIAAARRRHGCFGDRGADGGTARSYPFLTQPRTPTGWRTPMAPAPASCSAMRNRWPISASPSAPP